MALIGESKIRGEGCEIVVPVGQPFERYRNAYSIPELGECHSGDSGKDAADVEARVSENLGKSFEVRAGRVREDRLARMLDQAMVVASSCRSARGEAARSGAFRDVADKPCKPLVEFKAIDAPP
jgi:hypothetical protein